MADQLREIQDVDVTEMPAQVELAKVPAKQPIAPQASTHTNLNFGNQPTEAGGDYTSNTAQLNAYAHNNMV